MLWVFLLKSAVVSEFWQTFLPTVPDVMGTLVPSPHKEPILSWNKNQWQLQQTCKKTHIFTTGSCVDCCRNCTGINFHARKAPREKSLTIQLPGKPSIAHKTFRTHCFQLESQCRLLVFVYPVLLFELSLVEKQLNWPPYVWKSWLRQKCQVGYCFNESR